MGSFEDEVLQIQEARRAESAVKGNPLDSDWFPDACEPYIEYTCDAIRREIKLVVSDGKLSYDTVQEEGKPPKWINTPYYCTHWSVWCEVDFLKNDFFWERGQHLKLSDIRMFYYVLDQLERRLMEDGIYPAQLTEENKRHIFPPLARYTKSVMVRTHLTRNGACDELRTAQEQYDQGIGPDFCSVYADSYFVYDSK